MSMFVLLTGTLHKEAVLRISQNGNNYVTCTVRVEQDGQTLWANVICFDLTAQEELLRLRGGDALAIQGKAFPKVYMKDEEARPSLQVTATSVLPIQQQSKPDSGRAQVRRRVATRKDTGGLRENDAPAMADFDDPIDF